MKYDNYDLFDDVFNSVMGNWTRGQNRIPVVDVVENEKNFLIEAELPGFSLEDVNVEVDNHVLTIENIEKEYDAENKNYIIRERKQMNFKRRFTLPENVEEDKINGNFSNGVLVITIPKKEKPAPKKISVKLN